MKPGLLRRLQSRLQRPLAITLLLAAIATGARYLYTRSPNYGLPFQATWSQNVEDPWSAYGGVWQIRNQQLRNDSNDRGAKLLTGSPHWRNYEVQADFQMLGSGSVGILARVRDPEVGEDSFKGYFAAVRSVDNALILGGYDFFYHEAAKVVLPDPVRPFRWYRIKLRVENCQISVSATAAGMPEIHTAPLHDPDCFQTGLAGLRSNGTGAIWRNFAVHPLGAITPLDQSNLASTNEDEQLAAALSAAKSQSPAPNSQSVNSLQYLPTVGSPQATIRGSVILTTPFLAVQDPANFAAKILPSSEVPLKIGDEVEVSGEVKLDQYNPYLCDARIRLLREAIPLSPLNVSAHQIASGTYDTRFVQVEAYLRGLNKSKDGALIFDLDAGNQTFQAILPAGRSRAELGSLAPESRLRLKGISLSDPAYNTAQDPFVLLLRTMEDIDVVAGPPWWTPSTLILTSLAAVALGFLCIHFYLVAQHWRLRAISEEREMLAHEIHDTLAQSFAGLGFQLQAIRNSLPAGADQLRAQVDLALSMARTSHGEARHSIASLRPNGIEEAGLLSTLRDSATRLTRNGGVRVEVAGDEVKSQLPPRIKDALYRIGQEAIANSIRHGAPESIRIAFHSTRTHVLLTVTDDGKGYEVTSESTGDHAGEPSGFGLLGMRKRAESINASLHISSAPGRGTRVEVKAPVGSRLWPFTRKS